MLYAKIFQRFSEDEKLGELLEKSKKIRNPMHSYFMRPQLFHSRDVLVQMEIPAVYIIWQ
jgi:hypothetical protein